jgi:4-amino-4-deoxy-L-arabinose transferase-like glycosyltransferase
LTVLPSLSRVTFPNGNLDAPGRVGAGGIVLIFILGLVIRLFACQHTYIVNPDGVYYIHQARAIYYGEWNSLTSCALTFVSIYPFFVAAAYALFHEWVVAAQFVSLLFGSMTLVPFYLLCRRFFDRDISTLTSLVFALLPFFVAGSAEAVRDPVCWFFLTLGLCFFIELDQRNDRLALLLSCLSFIMASWARIESALFIMVSFIYLLAVPQEGRIRKAAFFALPLIGALSLIFCAVVFLDKPLMHILRLHDIVDKLSAPFIAYEALRAGLVELRLAELMRQPLEAVMPHFLHKARNMVWLVGLGTLIKYMIRAYFYFFFILFLLGLGGVWRRLREDRRIAYLSLLSLSAFILFYLHVIQTWMMFDRFWAIFMLPAFVVIGFGVQKTVLIMKSKCRLKTSTALFIACLLILICALPKDLKGREADKIVYKQMGEFIAEREGSDREIRILKSLRTPNWISFYANLNYEGAACPTTNFDMEAIPFEETVFKDYDAFVRYLKKGGITYFLWEEKAWPACGFNFLDRKRPDHLKEIGAWHHPDTGRVILYKVVPQGSAQAEAINPSPVR